MATRRDHETEATDLERYYLERIRALEAALLRANAEVRQYRRYLGEAA